MWPGGWSFENGGWTRRTTIVPLRRLQHRTVVQKRPQRRAGLASFAAAVGSRSAGGRLRLEQLDAGAAFALLDRLGPPAARASAPAGGRPSPCGGEGE